jgi:hypothetical protein
MPREDMQEAAMMASEPLRRFSVPEGRRRSYADLVERVPRCRCTGDALPLSAVVVPTARAPGLGGGLALASWIAEVTGAQLLVVRGGAARGWPLPRVLVPASAPPAAVVDVPSGATSILPAWESGRHVVTALGRPGDLGLERNLGLLLGRMCGWSSTLLLSDDPGSPPFSTARLGDVGYVRRDDDSVVHQARLLLGEPAEPVTAGGALVVRADGPLPMFPPTYGADRLFLFHLMLTSDVRELGRVCHRNGYPFTVARARQTELGDLFAETLFGLLPSSPHEVLAVASSPTFWAEVVWRRQELILRLLASLRATCGGPRVGVAHDAESALRAALAAHSSVDELASTLADYFWTVAQDQARWSACLSRASGELTLDESLTELGLASHTTWLSAKAEAAVS